jgi:hypothetical protein
MTKESFKLPSQASLELANELKARINHFFQLLFRLQQNRPSVILCPRT